MDQNKPIKITADSIPYNASKFPTKYDPKSKDLPQLLFKIKLMKPKINEGDDINLLFPTLSIKLLYYINENKEAPFIIMNSVLFAEIGITKANEPTNKKSRKYIVHKIIYISQIEDTLIHIPYVAEEFNLYFCILPFKPLFLSNLPLHSMIINSLFPITQQIHTPIPPNDFPLMTAMINSQNTEFDSSLSQLFTFYSHTSNSDIYSLIERIVSIFSQENGFDYMIIPAFPDPKIKIDIKDKKADILLFFPPVNGDQIEPVISIDEQSPYHIISLITNTNGHWATQVSTYLGCYEIYEKAITKLETIMYSVPDRKICCLLYVRYNIYEYFQYFPFWPHPYVKNPSIIEYEGLGKVSGNDRAFYYDYNEKYNRFPCIPSPFPRSKTVIKTKPRKRGQLIWRVYKSLKIKPDNDTQQPKPVYMEGYEFTALEICKYVLYQCGEDENKKVALAKTRGYATVYIYDPQDKIEFPIESLLVLDIEDSNEDSKTLTIVSYAIPRKNFPICLKYFRPPRVFQSKTNYALEGVNCILSKHPQILNSKSQIQYRHLLCQIQPQNPV